MYMVIDSSVKIYMVRVRERLSADNRLQRYNKNSIYTNKSIFFAVFLLRARKLHTLGMYCLAHGVATNHS